MKKITVFFALLPVCLAASCDLFFSGNTGDEGSVTLSLGDAHTGVPEDSAVYDDLLPQGEGGAVYPSLGGPRIVVYNPAGKALRDYTFTGNQSSWKFSVPAGGPYWVDFSAPVRRPADPRDDPFPFVKSFGATVKLDAVEKGSGRELFLPLRVRETAIMVPYMPGGSGNMRTDVFAPFFDLPAEYPAVSSGGFVNRENLNDLCFDFDPYGRLYATLKSPSQLYRIENLKAGGGKKVSPDINLNTFNNAAFNLRDGQLYLITSGKKIVAVPRNWVAGFWDLVGDLFSDDVSSPVFTIDEEGAFYTIPGKGEISRTKDGKTDSFDIADIIKPAGQGWDEAKVEKREILDMKALNGYLYVLLYVFLNDGERRDYDYFAAIPLEAIKTGTVKGAGWAVGGRSADQLGGGRNTGRDSTEGFFGPKKIVGWGPERIYVYDFHNDKAGFHRIVEVDLRGRRISKAGLAASGEQKR